MPVSHIAPSLRSQTNTPLHKPGVSELIIPAREEASFELLLPMLAHLSYQTENRWLTWIGSSSLTKSELIQHQLNANSVRVIQSANDAETLWMMWDALNNGTSAFVVSSFTDSSTVTRKEIQQLENACTNGHSRALVVKMPV